MRQICGIRTVIRYWSGDHSDEYMDDRVGNAIQKLAGEGFDILDVTCSEHYGEEIPAFSQAVILYGHNE